MSLEVLYDDNRNNLATFDSEANAEDAVKNQ
jgi:hypothetical protein